jgi:hypothetical protein
VCVCVYVCVHFNDNWSPVKVWKLNTILSKGMERVNMCIFGSAVEEGS